MPTALELDREGWKPYLDAPRRTPSPPKPTPEERRTQERLVAAVHQAAALLKRRFAVRRVILFGSLADGDWFSVASDIDVAVEGLAPSDYWEAWRLVEGVIGERPVDLVEIEAAGESLRRMIERQGIEL
jgi:predicted nucleotidyltransferase